MRRNEKIVRTPSVYSMTDAEVFGVFFWCCVDDSRDPNVAVVDDEAALDRFERSFFSWSYVRNDQYLPQRPVDDDGYAAYLLFWVDDGDKPGYVFQVSAKEEGLRCVLYETECVDQCRTEYHRVCAWGVSPIELDSLLASNDDREGE